VHSNGDYFVGDWSDDHMNGYGKLFQKSTGLTYEGEWEDGLYHGLGDETWEDGSSYKGDFIRGKKEG